MKKFIKYGCFCMLLCITACTKDNNQTLPPETQIGAGTFGCKIDGKVWVSGGSNYATGQNTTAFYQHIYPSSVGYVFVISSYNYNDNPRTYFSIGFDSLKALVNMPIILSTGKGGKGGAGYTDGANKFTTSTTTIGELIFKKFDENNLIASGTFWFDAMNSSGEIIHVTEGQFDVKYTR